MDVTEQRKRRFTWSTTESLLVIGWFVGFVVFQMVSNWIHVKQGHVTRDEQMYTEGVSNAHLFLIVFLKAVSQFLSLGNIVLSVVVIYGILGVQQFVVGLRGKKNS